ncbi:MAG: flagellar filament capping protein FliD [Alphaproteobacteria bacterium]
MVTSSTSSNSLASIGSSIVNNLTGGSVDIQSLAQQLTDASKAPRQALIDAESKATDAKISSLGKITSVANDFQKSLTDLGDPRALGYSPQSSNPAAADFSFSSFADPKPVNFSFVVKQLATMNTVTFPPVNSSDYLVGDAGADSGTLTIKKADGTVIDYIDFSSTDKLTDLAEKINDSGKTNSNGLVATILTNAEDSSGNKYQSLQISRGTGSDKNFSIELTFNKDGSEFTDETALTVNTNDDLNSSSGTNAIILSGSYIDKTTNELKFQNTFESSSNTFTDLISGVNISVKSTTANNAPVNISSTANLDKLLNSLQVIIDGYNNILNTVKAETKYDSSADKRGGLSNITVAKTFIQKLQKLTTTQFPDGNGKTYTLADIGVKTKVSDGTLYIDVDSASKKIQTNPEIFLAVIASKNTSTTSTDPTGAIDQMKLLNNIIVGEGSDFSVLLSKAENQEKDKISEEQSKLDQEMDSMKTRYMNQFISMQSILSASKSDQSSLTSMMASWNASLKN